MNHELYSEMNHTVSAGGVVVNEDGKILIVNQNKNSWSLPKGHIDEGEDALAAARREIEEESGVKELELIKELGTYDRYKIGLDGKDNLQELKTIQIFLFKTSQMKLHPTDPANPIALWVEKSEVVEYLTHPKDKDFFMSIIDEF